MSYIPYPFPLAQMATKVSKTEIWYGFILNFFTVLLFAGLNEIAKELEYPFRAIPNDLPVRYIY